MNDCHLNATGTEKNSEELDKKNWFATNTCITFN